MTTYTTRHRPVSHHALPEGVSYKLTSLPREGCRRSDLPRSAHRFGEFTTNRELTEDEMRQFEIKRVYLPA